MKIVNPTFGRAGTAIERLAGDAVDWLTDPIALFSNSKPNARELLGGLRDALGQVRSLDNVGFVYKDSASQPAPEAVLCDVAARYKGAILAIAD